MFFLGFRVEGLGFKASLSIPQMVYRRGFGIVGFWGIDRSGKLSRRACNGTRKIANPEPKNREP